MEKCANCKKEFDPEKGVSVYLSPKGYTYPCCSRECVNTVFKERYEAQVGVKAMKDKRNITIEPDFYYSAHDVAGIMRVRYETVVKYFHAGKIRGKRFGRNLVFQGSDILDALDKCRLLLK